MEEIKVGDYVRTRSGKIDIFKEKDENYLFARCEKNTYWLPDIVNHSEKITDLIEVGDYVNGNRVYKITRACIYCMGKAVENKLTIHIKTILTHEQFEQNSYKF